MSNNPMKRPVADRRLANLKETVTLLNGAQIELPVRKGSPNWRKKVGQYA